MFSLSGKKSSSTLAALVAGEQGIAIASLGKGVSKPKLEHCDFVAWENSPHDQILADKVKQYGLHKRPVTTVMELGDCTILSVDAPDVPVNELRAAVRWQVKDLIDFHIDDAVIDVFDVPASGAGRQNSLYVVVTRTSTVQHKVDQLINAEANLSTIDIPELVLRNITAQLPEDEAGVAFIYLTRDAGLMIITRQQTLYLARTLDIGYEYLRQGLPSDGGLALADNASFDRLVLEVQRSLDYYDRYFVQPPVAGIVMAPTELPIPGLDEYLNKALGVAVRNLDVSEIVESEAPLPLYQQAHCLPAIGAALREEAKAL